MVTHKAIDTDSDTGRCVCIFSDLSRDENPDHLDSSQDPGLMNEYIGTGALGRFQGFLACIIGAAFVIAGPEYISMVCILDCHARLFSR